ncbi:MAG: magnesium transporter CorA family protein [Bacteroidetes bacterium]|nr:magnesium transporter CorA family protein [Bacteroidota bacterium]
MVTKFEIIQGRITPSEQEQSPIIVFTNPDDNEKKYLIEELKIDEHTLASALDPDELSRLEFEPDHTAVIFKRPRNYSAKDKLLFKVGSCGAFLFKNRLVLVQMEDLPLFDGKQFLSIQTLNEAVLKLLYRSIFHFLEHLKVMTMITDELESKINRAMENKYLLNLFTLEKSLVYYLNSINSNGGLIEKLKNNSAKLGLSTAEIELLDDLIIENNQCYRQSEIHSNILASLMDARASIVGNNLNVLMKTLNIVMLGIMVPTFVVSVFSMNVPIPLQEHEFSFWMILGLALISVAGIIIIGRKFKW